MESRLTKEESQEYAYFFKSMRHSIGYTLRQMANKLHIQSETLRSWERGKGLPEDRLSEITYEVRQIVKDFHKNKRLAG